MLSKITFSTINSSKLNSTWLWWNFCICNTKCKYEIEPNFIPIPGILFGKGKIHKGQAYCQTRPLFAGLLDLYLTGYRNALVRTDVNYCSIYLYLISAYSFTSNVPLSYRPPRGYIHWRETLHSSASQSLPVRLADPLSVSYCILMATLYCTLYCTL